MYRTMPLFTNIIINSTINKTPPIIKKFVVNKTLKLKSGKVRYKFNISYGGIYEGPYKKDSIPVANDGTK
jgi:hypothetical protein